MLPAQPNRSLIDGIDVLLALAGSTRSLGSRELARRLGLDPTRVNRLLKTLAAVGLAAQDADRRYIAGPGMHVLSAMSLFGSGLVRKSIPILEELDRFEMVVALGVLWRDQVAYLYHKSPGIPSSEALGRAGLFPATRSSIGLVLLAHRPESELEAYYGSRDASIPGFSSYRELMRVLCTVRAAETATVPVPTGTSRAAAIHAPNQPPYAAVAVSGRMPAEISEDVTRAIRSAAAAIASAAARS